MIEEIALKKGFTDLDLNFLHPCLNSVKKIYINPDLNRDKLRMDLSRKSGVYL